MPSTGAGCSWKARVTAAHGRAFATHRAAGLPALLVGMWGARDPRAPPALPPCPAGAQPPGGNAALLKRGRGEGCSSELCPPLGCQSVCLARLPQSCVLTVRRFVGSVFKCFAESGPRRSHCSVIILNCIHVLFFLGFQQILEAKVSASAMPRTRKSQIFYWCSSSDLGLWTFVIPQQRSTDAPATPGLETDRGTCKKKRHLDVCREKNVSNNTLPQAFF